MSHGFKHKSHSHKRFSYKNHNVHISENPMVVADEHVYTKTSDYLRALLADIRAAKKTINFETYIYNKDSFGLKVGQALHDAAQRGVKVRLLVDSAGTPFWGGSFTKMLEGAGVQTRVFHPFPWRLWQWSRSVSHMPTLRKMIYLLLKINSRNHRKVCIIDDKIAYIGSLNITKCHLEKNKGGDDWRDATVRLSKINLEELTSAFEAAWQPRQLPERIQQMFKSVDTKAIIRLNNTRHRRRVLYKNLLRHLSRCSQRIWIMNAYFVPDNFLLRKLQEAAKRGVDVRILLPKKSDNFFIPWASSAFYASLLDAGVRIYEYLPSMLHAKLAILDQWFILGSSNLNYRSLLHDLEVDVNIRQPQSKQIIEQQFLDDMENSQEIRLDNWVKRPFYQRFIGKLILYLKYWI